jgi:hypothetical protein
LLRELQATWSEGEWTGLDYRVAYAMGASPTGPFKRIGTILEQDGTIRPVRMTNEGVAPRPLAAPDSR